MNKSMKQRFQEHMEHSKKLADQFKAMGVNIDFDEKSGEITIKGDAFKGFPKSCEECRNQEVTRVCIDKTIDYVCPNRK